MSPVDQLTVGHFVSPFLPLTENWIYNQINYLSDFRPIVLTYHTENQEMFPFEPIHSVFQLPRPYRFANQLLRKLTGGQINLYFSRAVRSENCSLLHAHFGPTGFYSLPLKQRANLPLVTTFYGDDASETPKLPGWREKYQRLFAEGDMFLAEGSHLRKTLIELGCPPEKVFVQRLGVVLKNISFTPRDPDRDVISVLMAASFVEKKGFPDGLKALAKVNARHGNLKITVIGDGKLRAEIEALIANLGLEVRLLGYQPHDVMLSEMAKADIFLHPSITAANGSNEGGAPVSIIEAQATGLPVVATKHADIPEVVKDGETGLLADEGDIGGLAEHIDYLITHPEERAAMSKAGRAHVEAKHDLEVQVRKLEGLYRSVLGHGS